MFGVEMFHTILQPIDSFVQFLKGMPFFSGFVALINHAQLVEVKQRLNIFDKKNVIVLREHALTWYHNQS